VEQARARDDAMSDNDRIVSPYLLRPLRTLDQVLGGRGRALEPGRERVEGRQEQDRRWVVRNGGSRTSIPPFTTTG
jgi:hypothetical protein